MQPYVSYNSVHNAYNILAFGSNRKQLVKERRQTWTQSNLERKSPKSRECEHRSRWERRISYDSGSGSAYNTMIPVH